MIQAKPEIGDLVHVGGTWNMDGIILADDTASYVLTGHFDISSCIVSRGDITSIIRKKAIDPEMVKYLKYGGFETYV